MADTGKGRLTKGVLAAAALAAAGYYFYASKNAKKNRQVAAKWATDMKRDVVKRAKALKNVDRAAVAAVVEQSARAYKGIRGLDRGEVERAAKELKKNWQKIAAELKKGSAKVKSAAKHVTKRGKAALKSATR
ncbi:MAG: hypothetical protein AAB790_03895 [Patescibacteria group bacterium]